jgi:hypothetical protein
MSDRPDKPSDKVNDGDGRGLSASVQNQVFEDMMAQSKESNKWKAPSNTSTDSTSAEQAGAAQGTTASKTATDALVSAGGSKPDPRGSDGGSMLTATSRAGEDLVGGQRQQNDNAAKAAMEQAKSLGINVSRDQIVPGNEKVQDGNSIVIPILNEFIRDGVRAIQERPPVTAEQTMAAVNTEIQRRQQVDATVTENHKQQQLEAQNPTTQRPEGQTGMDSQRPQSPESEATRDQSRDMQAQKQSDAAAVKESIESRPPEATIANRTEAIQAANDQAASRVTENIANKGAEINRVPIEVGATTDLQGSANARGSKGAVEAAAEVERAAKETDTTKGAVDAATADSRAAAQAIADGNAAPEVEQKADVKESGKGKETSEDGERKGIAAVARAIADFARKVLDKLFGKGGETDEKGEGGDSEEEQPAESEDERQRKVQEERRPTYIVMEGDYLELVCTKLYATSSFAPLLKALNPKMTVNRQYLAVYQRDVDMLKAGEELLLPTKNEIEEFLRTQ